MNSIRIRIAVAIDTGGEWNANGWGGREQPYEPDAMKLACECLGNDAARYWIEVELPIPNPPYPPDAEVITVDVPPPED